METLDAAKLKLELHIYQLIIKATHAFKPGTLYSFPALEKLTGATKLGLRLRAFTDGWPLIEPYSSQGNRRNQFFVDGAFLRKIQKSGGEA